MKQDYSQPAEVRSILQLLLAWNILSIFDKKGLSTRVGYRLGFFRYRCQIDTFKTVPVPEPILVIYIYCIYIYIHIHTHTHILYMELMKLQEIPIWTKALLFL